MMSLSVSLEHIGIETQAIANSQVCDPMEHLVVAL
jgi:hypothetical protein